jgi:hypothetical protein
VAFSLARYCAFWFVQTQLRAFQDTDPPEDAPLLDIDRARLALRVLNAVASAELSAGDKIVVLDATGFITTALDCHTVFDLSDCVLMSARASNGARPDPKSAFIAFGDFIATRWIYRQVLHENITVQPAADEAFPPPYDADAKRGLAIALASNCASARVLIRDKDAFLASASHWRSLAAPRAALLKHALAALLALFTAAPARGQVMDAGGTSDQTVSLYLQKAAEEGWQGGAATRGEAAFGDSSLRANWQLDYGSTRSRRVSPTGVLEAREADVSKNSGVLTLGLTRPLGDRWRFKVDAGIEHRRSEDAVRSRRDDVHALGNASARAIGARTLWRDNVQPQISWLLQTNVSTSRALAPDGEVRRGFFEPVIAGWLAFLPGYVPVPNEPPFLFRRVLLRAELAGTSAFDRRLRRRGHWDGSMVLYLTPEMGVMLRRFSGFFDHNLRDRKAATTISLLWKFR